MLEIDYWMDLEGLGIEQEIHHWLAKAVLKATLPCPNEVTSGFYSVPPHLMASSV